MNGGWRTSTYRVWGAIGHVAGVAIRYIVDVRVFVVFRFAGGSVQPIVPQVPIDIQSLSIADISMICGLYGVRERSRKHQTFLHRFADGADCFGGFHGGQLVSIGWILYSEDVDRSTGFVLSAAANEVIFSDGLTAARFRGLRIRPYIVNHQIKHCFQRGYSIITAVESSNEASLRNVRRVGFRETGQVTIIRLFGIRIL